MYTVAWNKRYEIGVDFIDKEHKQLFATMSKLLTLGEDKEKQEWVCKEGIKYIKNHTLEHFDHEEAYMESIEYSDYEIHKRLHDNFRNYTLPALEKELEETGYSTESIRHFLGVCIGWVVSHTQTEDQAIGGKGMTRWMDVPQDEEMDVLEQTIVQTFDKLVQMKAKVVSRHYEGENFGKMIALRFIYGDKKEKKWEVLLCCEEKFLMTTVANMLDTKILKVDDLVININRYFARQFLENISECFPDLANLEVVGEALLTYEQVEKKFETEQPTCSLLLDTGAGYFAFCVTATDSLRGKIVSPINHQNAMSQINSYLAGEKRKKKILIVDDSDFMRKNVINLLQDDYEMLESSSSVAAIKRITVDRPDLILLDYEMPVCDGRQTLEMIRSDEEIADIPVIFLTNKGDAESVKKVMALKPNGYLLKTMPEQEIKNIISNFFARRG